MLKRRRRSRCLWFHFDLWQVWSDRPAGRCGIKRSCPDQKKTTVQCRIMTHWRWLLLFYHPDHMIKLYKLYSHDIPLDSKIISPFYYITCSVGYTTPDSLGSIAFSFVLFSLSTFRWSPLVQGKDIQPLVRSDHSDEGHAKRVIMTESCLQTSANMHLYCIYIYNMHITYI